MIYDLRFGRVQSLDYPQARIRNLKDRFQHTYIMGPSGCGKSTLMTRMAVNDIRHDLAAIFLDPKAEHLDDIYSLLTEEERQRVIYYSYDHPSLVFNPLRRTDNDVYDLADELSEILDIIIAQVSSSNPPASENMKDVIRESLPILREEDRELEILHDFLRYEEFRNDYFRRHYNGRKTEYWKQADQKTGGRLSDVAMTAGRVAIRLGKLVKPERYKKLFSGPNEFDVADIVRKRKILLVDTSAFTEEKLYYIVGLISHGIKSYCRKRIAKDAPLIFYFDECHLGINDSFIFALAFARSSNVGIVLANQFITQFKNPRLFDAILSQCGTKVVFGQRDVLSAKTMANALGLKEAEVRNLEKYQAWVNIFEKLSLVKTFPPEMPEKKIGLAGACDNAHMPTREAPDGPEEGQPVYLRECWFNY